MRGGRRGGRRVRKVARGLIPLLPQLVRLFWGLMLDRRVSRVNRWLVVAALVYALSPLDLVPDFLGLLGLTDDLFLLGLAIRRLLRGEGEEVIRAHWTGTAEELERLEGGMDGLGTALPGPVRRGLESYAARW